MPTAEEIFIQYYRFAIQEIELIRIRNCKLIKERQFVYDQERRRAFDLVIQYFENELDQINSELHAEVPDPEVLIWRCVSALNRLEKSHFLMSNLIEAVKRDESLQNVLIRYQHLEIFSSENGRLTEETRNSPWLSNRGAGALLEILRNGLKKVAFTVMEIFCNALKCIPKFIALRPKPSIGLSGPFPTISLQFDIEAESVTIHELLEGLKGAAA